MPPGFAASLSAPPQQERSRRSLERIMTAAEAVLLRGADDFTITNVATEGGLTVGGIYARFRSKDELLQALKDRVVASLEDTIQAEFAPRCFGSTSECLEAFTSVLLKHVPSNELLQRQLLAAGDRNRSLHNRGWAARMRIQEIYCAQIARVPGFSARRMKPFISLSFELIVAPWIERWKTEGFHQDLSWAQFAAQLQLATNHYLQAVARTLPIDRTA